MKGRPVSGGYACGEALVTSQMFGFFGAIRPETGEIIDEHHELYGACFKDKIFVFPEGRGSTVGAVVLLELVRTGNAPAAIINRKTESIIATGAILAEKLYGRPLPLVDLLDEDPIAGIRTGDIVAVNGDTGEVEVKRKKDEADHCGIREDSDGLP